MATVINGQSMPGFSKFALGISVFFFLCTFPYWFFSSDSDLSIINILLGKVDRSGMDYAAHQKMRWGTFYSHLILTGIGLLIYYASGFQRWVGNTVSYRYLSGMFLTDNKNTRKWMMAFKVVMGLLLLILLYEIFSESVKATEYIPRITFTIFILIFFITTAGWNVSYTDPLPIPNFEGSMDNRNKVMLVKLSDDQVAYVQDTINKNNWILKDRKDDVDLSFTEAYIFNINKFKHHLYDVPVVESVVGTIQCKIDLEPLLNYIMPASLGFKKLQYLNTLKDANQIKSIVFLALDQNAIKTEIEEKMNSLNTYFATHPRSSFEEWNEKFEKIDKEISSGKLDASIGRSIQELVDKELDAGNVFKVTCTITRDTAREYFRNTLESHRQKMSADVQQAAQREREMFLDAITFRMKQPGLPFRQMKELQGLYIEMNNPGVSSAKVITAKERFDAMITIVPEEIESPELAQAVKDIAEILMISKKQHYDIAETKELIAGATSYFEQQAIPIELFFERLFENRETEKEERTENDYRKLVGDILKQFLKSE